MRKNGFTLFEILMALAILGVVFSLLYMTFHQSMAAMDDAGDRADVIQQGRLILERMGEELRGSFIPAQEIRSQAIRYGLVGRSNKERDDFMDRLDFTALAHPQENLSNISWGVRELGYFLDRMPEGAGFTLLRRQDDALDGDLLRGGRSLPLCDRVLSLSFSFFDRQGTKKKKWNTLEGAHAHELPRRIEIHLKLEDSRGRMHSFITQVYLPLAGEKR